LGSLDWPRLIIDEPELAAGGVEEHGPRIDRLHDIAGQRQLEGGHGRLLVRSMPGYGPARPAEWWRLRLLPGPCPMMIVEPRRGYEGSRGDPAD
jgi:hypothetical protein